MAGIAAWEVVGRRVPALSIAEAGPLVQHLNLVLVFVGAVLAAREGKLLRLASGEFFRAPLAKRVVGGACGAVGSLVCVLLCQASYQYLDILREETGTVGGIPTWGWLIVLPVAFGAIALRLVWYAGGWAERGFALLGLAAGAFLWTRPELLEGRSAWIPIAILIGTTVLGLPLFVTLAGCAYFLFQADWVPPMVISVEIHSLATSPFLASIPLFTLTGFLLAEGRAPERLLGVFRAWFGWFPGGTAVVCVVLSSFFTVFTGGSGVTILALGALLLHALTTEGYRERFSVGLLTGSGSLGLLLPPALPLILFAIAAEQPVDQLFVAGILPGILLTALVALWGMWQGWRGGVSRQPFEPGEACRSLWEARFELLLPVLVVVFFFSGLATLVEVAALSALYALAVQLLRRDVRLGGHLLKVLREATALLGGVLIILGAATGLSSWMVDAMIPAQLLDWMQERVSSPLMFLLCLNVFLLLVGCVMDIYSATFVVVPLILPLGIAYDIDPVHLGIIFVANLELGYLTPPVGLNLFLASYRFEKPLLTVYRAALPMLLILGIGVLLITYEERLTLGLIELFGMRENP